MNEIELAKSVADGGSGLIGGVIVLLILAIPLVVKMMSWARETSANGTLYQQLAEQVRQQREELDKVYRERNELFERVANLQVQVNGLENAKLIFDTLKAKLEQKDAIIAERDARIVALTQEVMVMKDRIHSLELRLSADEKEFCRKCEHPKPRPLVTV